MGGVSRPRVLILSPDFPPMRGGIQLLVFRLTSLMSRLRPRVVALSAPDDASFDSRLPFEVVRSRRGALPHKLAVFGLNARAVVEAWRFRPAVVMNAHIVTAPAAALIRKLLKIPVFLYLYADEVAERPRLSRFASRSSDAVVSISRHTSELALRVGADESRMVLIPPGVDVPERVERRNGSGRPRIVTISRINERYKGHDTMLRAMQLVLETVPDAEWVVIGDGPLRPEFEREARCSGASGARAFHRRDLGRRARLVATARRRLCPGQPATPLGGGEGFGIVFLEAAAHGVPAVAGNEAGVRDAVVDGETGVLVDPSDPAALASALTELLLDPDKAKALGRNARARAEQFAWPVIARRVEELALDLARRRARE